MANALIYTQSGGGKTCNSTLVEAPKRGKNLLICTDNSSIVLQNFKRPNLEVINVSTVKDFADAYQEGYHSKKPVASMQSLYKQTKQWSLLRLSLL